MTIRDVVVQFLNEHEDIRQDSKIFKQLHEEYQELFNADLREDYCSVYLDSFHLPESLSDITLIKL